MPEKVIEGKEVMSTILMAYKMKKRMYTLKPTEAGNVLLTAIQRFFAEGKLVDVKISSENVVLLSCHKIILASFSSYFETLLTETEGATVLNMDSISVKHAKHLRSIVNFMYGYNIQVYRKDCPYLLEAAKMFGVCALIKTLQSTLDRQTQDTVKSQNDLLILKPTGISSLLLVNFQRFKKENKFIDAKIGLGENTNQFFLSHKLVLASFSTYFESLLQGTESCAVLGLESVDPLYVRQLETIMDYMYGQVVSLDDRQVEVLRDAAKVFGIYSLEEGELMKLCNKALRDRQQRLLDQKLASLRDYGGGIDERKEEAHSSNTPGVKFVYLSSTGTGASAQDAEIIRKGWKGANLVHAKVEAGNRLPENEEEADLVSGAPEGLGNRSGEADHSSPFFGSQTFGSTSGAENSNDATGGSLPSTTSSSALDFSGASSAIIDRPAVTSHSTLLIGDDVCVAPPLCSREDLLSSPGDQPPASFVEVNGSEHSDEAKGRIDVSDVSGGKYLCVECGKLFKSTQSLTSHVKSKHRDTIQSANEKKYARNKDEEGDSNLIGGDFADLEDYEDDRNEFEAEEFEESEISDGNLEDFCQPTTSGTSAGVLEQKQDTKSGGNDNGKVRECPECDFRTRTLKSLKAHVAQEHNGTINICQRCAEPLQSRAELNTHLRKVHKAELYSCDQCDKLFHSKPGLNNHVQVHSAELYRCSGCDYAGKTKSCLNMHMRKYHFLTPSGEKLQTQFACAECKQTFPYKSLYARHFKSTHLKVKSFRCPYDCDYAAVEKGALQAHIRCMHTREKPFACPTCKERFLTQSHLARHKRNHVGSRPHVCPECDEAFVEKRDLRAHVYKAHRTDRPFPCPQAGCDRGFLRKDHLLNHRRKIHGYED